MKFPFWPVADRAVSIRFFIAGAILTAGVCLSHAQVEGALVARHGVTVQGTVEGAVLALEDTAVVTVERGAVVTGDLIAPAGKGAEKSRVSSQAKIAIADSAAIKGKQRVVSGFEIPRTRNPRAPQGKKVSILQTPAGDEPDFKDTKDFTINHAKRELSIPPGAYGDLTVTNGRVILGEQGSIGATHYDFQSITVRPNARIDLAGPVIITVGSMGKLQGSLGNSDYANWLDLRVAEGDFDLEGSSEVHGVITATTSAVTLGKGAKLRGGLVCDRATVQPMGKFTGIQPSWSKESSGNSLPLFIHKAARVEYRVPDLRERYGADHLVKTSYGGDEPTVAFLQTKAATKADPYREERVFFDACCAVFDGTGFTQGSVILSLMASEPNSLPKTIQVKMERGQFEDHVWAIGRKRDLRAGIRAIREEPALLHRFMGRVLKVANEIAVKGEVR